MGYLVDTSVIVRLANVADPFFAVADQAVARLHQRGERLFVTAQNLVEFRNAATRPATANGLGLTPAQAEAKAMGFEAVFPLLVETPDIFVRWKSLVGAIGIVGKQVHDARLVAVCHVHAVSHLLTFNISHFARMASHGPGLIVVHPSTV